MSFEKYNTNKPDQPLKKAEFSITSSQSEKPGSAHGQTAGHNPDQPPRKATPEVSRADDPWTEYLLKTGNPMLENMMNEAGAHLQMEEAKGSGDIQAEAKARKRLDALEREEMDLLTEILPDIALSASLLTDMKYTGDTKKDAENLFRALGAKRALEMLRQGAEPLVLLKGFDDVAELIVRRSKDNPAFRKAAYTAISIKRIIDRIMKETKD